VEHAAVAQDGGEQVVEIVGDAAGELADRFQLVGMSKLILELLALRRASA